MNTFTQKVCLAALAISGFGCATPGGSQQQALSGQYPSKNFRGFIQSCDEVQVHVDTDTTTLNIKACGSDTVLPLAIIANCDEALFITAVDPTMMEFYIFPCEYISTNK